MAQKRLYVKYTILILITILLIALAYSLVSLNMIDDASLTDEPSNSLFDSATNSISHFVNTKADAQLQNKPPAKIDNKTANPQSNNLPYEFTVIGISDLMLGQEPLPIDEIKVLIKFEDELYEHSINDYLLNTDMQLVNIEANQISISFEHFLYTKPLTLPNLLSSNFKDQEKSYSELLQMSPEEISTRPRIIEHLVNLTSTPYIADGKLVSVGLNPRLFKQAGFKEDDVLKEINGKSVTIDSEFEDIKEELKTAQTLKMLVMRKGRMITLYLDIPSEGLDIARD